MDLSTAYSSVARKYFTNAVIVASHFHVIRLINHHFLKAWRDLDPVASRSRGMLLLMRRHEKNLKPEQKEKIKAYLARRPDHEIIYRFKQEPMYDAYQEKL
jgi:transposase